MKQIRVNVLTVLIALFASFWLILFCFSFPFPINFLLTSNMNIVALLVVYELEARRDE